MPKRPVSHDYLLRFILRIQVFGYFGPALLAKLGQNPDSAGTQVRIPVVLAEKTKDLLGCVLPFGYQLGGGMGTNA